MITIFHNPRCSKSREALALVQQCAAARNLPLTVIDYQKTPLTLEQLSALHRQLRITVREMVRDSEEDYAALKLETADDTILLQTLAAHPKLLQRPIVVYGDRAVIGRPPERVNTLLDGTLAA